MRVVTFRCRPMHSCNPNPHFELPACPWVASLYLPWLSSSAALPRDGGQRSDMWCLRAAHHRLRPVLLRLSSVMRTCWLFRYERLFPLFGPQFSRPFTVLAFELVGDPDHRAVDHGAVVTSEFGNTRLDDEATELDEMPRSLAAFDLPRAHVMPRLCCPMAIARRPIAFERRQCRGQALM